MSLSPCSDEEFARIFQTLGANGAARHLKISPRAVFDRRLSVEKRLGVSLQTPLSPGGKPRNMPEHSQRQNIEIDNGVVLVGSDAHYWPGYESTSHRAFIAACKWFQKDLRAVVLNGDVFDGSSISRHPPMNYADQPSVKEEIEACQERLSEVEVASGNVTRYWTLGNHDSRYEGKLASSLPEYSKTLPSLKDWFPLWIPCWSVWINDNVVIKHRFRNGIHAGWNNTLHSGKNIVTGHTHKLGVTAITDYNGTRFAVETGMLAPAGGPMFDYAEDNPANHREGFAVLTFINGRLAWPELVHVVRDGVVEFRGREHGV